MTADACPAPTLAELPIGLTDQLPAGAVVRAQTRLGQRLILALDGVSAGLGWFDLDALEPRWQPLPSQHGERQVRPILALLASGTEFLAISGDRISAYRWGDRNAAPEPVRTVRLALEAHQILATARTERHVAILANRISQRTNSRSMSLWHTLGRPALTHRRTELLLLLEAGSFRELGSAALEQRFDPERQAPPPLRWTGLRLSETHLQLQDGIAGPLQIPLGEGPVEDLQQQLRSGSSQAFKAQEYFPSQRDPGPPAASLDLDAELTGWYTTLVLNHRHPTGKVEEFRLEDPDLHGEFPFLPVDLDRVIARAQEVQAWSQQFDSASGNPIRVIALVYAWPEQDSQRNPRLVTTYRPSDVEPINGQSRETALALADTYAASPCCRVILKAGLLSECADLALVLLEETTGME